MYDLFTLETDVSKEVQGVWRDFGMGARVLVARAGNTAYAKVLGEEYEKHKEVLERGGPEADSLNDQLMVQVLARTILLGWEGFAYKKAPLAYSLENAAKMLAIRDFRTKIMTLANEVEHYRVKEEEEQGKA